MTEKETKEYRRHEIGEGRRQELHDNIDEVFERYEKTFGVKISDGEILEIIEESFRDVQKNWVRKILGAITYTDRDYLVRLFKTRKFHKELDAEEENTEEPVKERKKRVRKPKAASGGSTNADGEAGSGEPVAPSGASENAAAI